jgi:hypothetical protein
MRFALLLIALAPFPGFLRADDRPPVQASQAAGDQDAGRDRGKVYRYDLATETLEAMPPATLRPGHVYSRFNRESGQWVWSKADARGGLHYAMGEGSVQPARMFDLRGTEAERMRILEERAPELARLMTIQGARPMLKLDADGRWGLGPTPSVSSVYDITTRERWEWHADAPARVMHTSGYRWMIDGGRYVPGS